jgi:hypothetical protein
MMPAQNKTREEEKRVLKISVFQKGHMIDELAVTDQKQVSIGYLKENTIVLPSEDKNPASQTIFEKSPESYDLVLNGRMEGKIIINEKVQSVKTLLNSDSVKRIKEDICILPLTVKTRGKIVFGDINLIFQFVKPHFSIPRMDLPGLAKGAWLKNIDEKFFLALFTSFILQTGLAGGIDIFYRTSGQYQQKQISGEDNVLMRLFAYSMKIKKMKEPARARQKQSGEDPVNPDKDPAGNRQTYDSEKSERYRESLIKVQNQSVLRYIGSKYHDGNVTLENGSPPVRLTSLWDLKGSIKVLTYDDFSLYDTVTRIKNTGSINPPDVKKDVENLKPDYSLNGYLKKGGSAGSIDIEKVGQTFKRRMPVISKCFEEKLQINPDLTGKVTVKFTIDKNGKIKNIAAIVNTTKDEDLANCIIQKMRDWKFYSPSEGEPSFIYSFVLKKG